LIILIYIFKEGDVVLTTREIEVKAIRTKIATIMLAAAMAVSASSLVVAETYDVVINNGRVMDRETTLD
jgi:hypothetical protein